MEATAAVFDRVRVLQALRSRDFRLLWTGQVISLAGDAAFMIALGWRTFTLTGSARSLGYVLMLQAAGMICTLLVGGALADRYDRRTLMLVSDFARFGIVAALTVVDATGHLSFGGLATLAFLEGFATGFFMPAFGGVVPLVVEQPMLASANALVGVARQGSFLAGPALAGLLYGLAGSSVVFGFEALSFLCSAAFVWRTKPRPADRQESNGTLREIAAGARYVASVPWLWVTIALFSVVLMLQYSAIQVLLPKLVKQQFGLGVGAYGFLVSMLGGGMIIGMVAFGQTNPRRKRGLISYAVWILNSLLVIGIGLAPWFGLALGFGLLRGICIGYGVAIWETLLMELVPQEMLSRVISLDWFGSLGLTPIGLVAAGAISGVAKPGTIIAVSAAISAALVGSALCLRSIREME
jgi:MFS family permease